MKIHQWLFLLILPATATAFADDAMQEAFTRLQNESNYCVEKGGQVIPMQAEFDVKNDTGKPQYGITKNFCVIDTGDPSQNEHVYSIFGLDTFGSREPTIAASFAKKLVINPHHALPTTPYSNPSVNVCHLLQGASISYHVTSGGFSTLLPGAKGLGNQYDICVFGDGSSISGWTLIYLAAENPDRPNVKASIRLADSDVLAIDMPQIN